VTSSPGGCRDQPGNPRERIRPAEHASFARRDKPGYGIAFSHGIVEIDPERPRALEALLAQGDALMYGMKRSRR